jgi:hypothetical protein
MILTSFSSAEIPASEEARDRTIIDSEPLEFVNDRDKVKIPAGRVPLSDESPTKNSISPFDAASETSRTTSRLTP